MDDFGHHSPMSSAPSSIAVGGAAEPPAVDLGRACACAAVSLLIGLTQGLSVYLVNNNLSAIQGSLGATATEAGWLTTAYYATSLSAVVLLTKMRMQFGLRHFAEWGIVAFLLVSAVHLAVSSLSSAIAVRAAMGVVTVPLNTLTILYMIEAWPKRLAPVALILGFATLQFGAPLSRVLAESLLQPAQLQGFLLLEVALALACFAAIVAVRLPPPPLQNVLNSGDGISFAFYASGLALLSVVCTQGRVAWWTDTGWIGVCLAAALTCLGAYIVIELRRSRPLLDLRWLCRPAMLRFVSVVLLFRIVLSEQPIGAITLMNTLGFNNDQMHGLFGWVAVGTLIGFGLSLLALPLRNHRLPALVAVVLIFIAAVIDAEATSLTRPADLYLSQTLIAIGTAMFLSSALLIGFVPVIRDGMRNFVSFLAVFSASQGLGSLLGSAGLGTFLADRRKLHYAQLIEHFTLADPQVVARIAQGSAAYGAQVNDPLQRGALGVAALAQQATREAYVLAYNDLFQLIAILSAATFVWLSVIIVRSCRREAAERRAADTDARPVATS
jgi:MFS family permease